jgi:8-oxo-dGTP pyrophosphatase MutT (NUDIX family)
LSRGLTGEKIRAALEASAGHVPAVTERMLRRTLAGVPVPRPARPPEGVTARQGAVMALLYPLDDEIVIVLTERTAHLGNHGGQISMPGGRIEPDDLSPWHAAVRETHEEIGIDLSASSSWGALNQIYVAASRFYVTAFVAYVHRRPPFSVNPDEVASLLEVPLRALMASGSFCTGERDYEGQTIVEGFFQYKTYKIWGATAVLLDQLLTRIEVGLKLTS